jgi:hypothetical protein
VFRASFHAHRLHSAEAAGPPARARKLALCSTASLRRKTGMKRVDTFGFFTLAAAGVPLRRAWAVRGRRLSPFSGSVVRSKARLNLLRIARPVLSQFACWSLRLGQLGE